MDICEETIFTAMAEVILDEPSNGIPCIDTAEYEWKPYKICEVDVVITCETADGTPIDCNATPLDETSGDRTVDVNYIYTVTNVGPTYENIRSLSRTLNVNIKDLTSALDATAIDICQEESTISVSAELDATSPCGTPCEKTAVYKIDVEKICDVEYEAKCVLADYSNTY